MTKRLGKASSGKYLVIGNLVSKVFVLAGSIVLARILFPEDYGYLVIATLFDGVFNLFSISGFETYYIQKRDITDEQDTVLLGVCYWLRIRQSIVLFVLQVLIGFGLWIWNDATLGLMVVILAINHLINIIGKDSEANLSKSLDFKPIAISNILRDVSGAIIKVLFAVSGYGPLSFVLGQVLSSIPRAIYLKRVHNLRVQVVRKSDEIKKIIKFARDVFFNTVGAYLTSQADAAIVASFYPKSLVGSYHFAKKQSGLPFNFLMVPLNPMIFSYISKYRNAQEKLITKFSSTGVLINFMVLPFFIFAFFELEELISLVFGAKWIGTAPIVKIFLIYFMFQFVSYPSGYLPTALGSPGKKARISFICFGFLILALLTSAYFEAPMIAYAWAYVSIYMIKDVWVGSLGFRLLGNITYFRFLRNRLVLLGYLFILLMAAIALYFSALPIVYKVLLFVTVHLFLMFISLRYIYTEVLISALRELGGDRIISKLQFFHRGES